MTNTE